MAQTRLAQIDTVKERKKKVFITKNECENKLIIQFSFNYDNYFNII